MDINTMDCLVMIGAAVLIYLVGKMDGGARPGSPE